MSTFLNKKTLLYIIIFTAVLAITFILLPLSLPIVFAFITALFLEPLVRFCITRMKWKRNFSVFIIFMLFVCFIGVSGYFLVTKVVTEAINIGQNAPSYINDVNKAWENVEQNMTIVAQDLPVEVVIEISNNVESFLDRAKKELTDKVNFQNITLIISKIPNYLVSLIVYLIALFLFMIELPNIKKRVYSRLTSRTADKVTFMTSRLSFVVFGFFKAQFLVSIIIFFVSLIGLLFIAPEVALLMSFIIWIIDFIPIIGSIVILTPWALYQFLTGDVALGTKLVILAVVLLVIRRTVEPKVMGQQIGLSPLSTLISMYLGLKLIGVLGFIVGPLLVIAFNSAREAGIIKFNFKI